MRENPKSSLWLPGSFPTTSHYEWSLMRWGTNRSYIHIWWCSSDISYYLSCTYAHMDMSTIYTHLSTSSQRPQQPVLSADPEIKFQSNYTYIYLYLLLFSEACNRTYIMWFYVFSFATLKDQIKSLCNTAGFPIFFDWNRRANQIFKQDLYLDIIDCFNPSV